MKTKSSLPKQVFKARKSTDKKSTLKRVEESNSNNVFGEDEKFWQTLFILSEYWQSDLGFFNDELLFLQRLLKNYFVWISDDRILADAKKITAELILINKRKASCQEQVKSHLHHITNLLENPFSSDARVCKDEHAALKQIISGLKKDFQSIKREVFQLARIMDNQQHKTLLEA